MKFMLWLISVAILVKYDNGFNYGHILIFTAIIILVHMIMGAFCNMLDEKDLEDYKRYSSTTIPENEEIESIIEARIVVDYIKREYAPQFNNYSDDQIVGFIPRSEITQLARLIRDGSIKFGPEFERIANYIREINSPNFNNLSDLDIVSSMSYQEIERILRQININIHIPEDYILTNIKGFNNIEIYSNVKSFLIKPLKQLLNSSLCPTNKPIIINRNTIISELHLHYLLTVIDTAIAIGE